MQVKRPLRNVSAAFPRSHEHKLPSGKLNYFRIIDNDGGSHRAYEGDWIVRYEDGAIEVLSEGEFAYRFAEERGEDSDSEDVD